MDKRITIQSRTDTLDDYNEPVASWDTFKTTWAEVKYKSGREYFTSNQPIAEQVAIFRIRYLNNLTRAMRISFNSEIFNIRAINELGRKEGQEIIATAEVD